MAEIQPFAGIQYRGADLGKVLAPPYDVISPAYQDELYARDPHNIVRVILNRTPGDAGYQEAGETYARWLAEGVLAKDPSPAVYLLEQSFASGGTTLKRYGLLARFRAEAEAAELEPGAAVERAGAAGKIVHGAGLPEDGRRRDGCRYFDRSGEGLVVRGRNRQTRGRGKEH